MSKTTILVVCVFAGAIILGTATMTTADTDGNNGIPDRVSALESALAGLADDLDAHDHDGDYVMSTNEELVMIHGFVHGNGTVLRGEGFSVDYEGDGSYYVEFDEGLFSATPTVLVHARIEYVGTDFSSSGFRLTMSTGERHWFKLIGVGNP